MFPPNDVGALSLLLGGSQALALALPGYLTTGSYIPLLYPLYYVALLFPRQLEVRRV
jgi:hypothetical protein